MTAAHGLDASQYTFNYVAGWAHQAATPDGPSVEDIVKATGQRVISTADRILQTTQPAPSVADDALSDLTVQVTRPLDAVAVAPQAAPRAATLQIPQPSASAAPVGAVWERVESRPLDGAARERRTLPRTAPAPAHAVNR